MAELPVIECCTPLAGASLSGERAAELEAVLKALAKRRQAAGRAGHGRARPKSEQPQAPQGHRTAERRGLAYHALVAERLDGGMVEEAQERVERLASEGHLHPRYAERWRALLSRPLADIANAIVADTQEGIDLRQNSPFAGALNEQERRRIIETTR